MHKNGAQGPSCDYSTRKSGSKQSDAVLVPSACISGNGLSLLEEPKKEISHATA